MIHGLSHRYPYFAIESLGSILITLGHFGVTLASLWGPLLTLGSIWVTLGSDWGHFGITSGSILSFCWLPRIGLLAGWQTLNGHVLKVEAKSFSIRNKKWYALTNPPLLRMARRETTQPYKCQGPMDEFWIDSERILGSIRKSWSHHPLWLWQQPVRDSMIQPAIWRGHVNIHVFSIWLLYILIPGWLAGWPLRTVPQLTNNKVRTTANQR